MYWGFGEKKKEEEDWQQMLAQSRSFPAKKKKKERKKKEALDLYNEDYRDNAKVYGMVTIARY